MQLLNLSQQLFCDSPDLLLRHGALYIRKHVQVTGTLAQEVGPRVVDAVLTLIEICIQAAFHLFESF